MIGMECGFGVWFCAVLHYNALLCGYNTLMGE